MSDIVMGNVTDLTAERDALTAEVAALKAEMAEAYETAASLVESKAPFTPEQMLTMSSCDILDNIHRVNKTIWAEKWAKEIRTLSAPDAPAGETET